jgi:hypothetical protein
LRWALAALLALAQACFGGGAFAREAPLKVLLGTSIADDAFGTIAPALWSRYMAASLSGYHVIPFAGPVDPTLDDCERAGAAYLVLAPFEQRPQLPGLANASGRLTGRSHLVARNCTTGDVVFDQIVDFVSDPVPAGPGTDADAESPWQREIPATLARHPIVMQRPARVVLVAPPYARIGFRDATLNAGDVIKDVAHPNSIARSQPIVLTVTAVFDDYVEAVFELNGDHPVTGDIVER